MRAATARAAARLRRAHGLSASNTALYEGVLAGDRSSLARAVTLVESSRADDAAEAEALLGAVARASPRGDGATFRVGICGPPGVGKSSFVEALGNVLLDASHDVAVLAIDPSSQRVGGSLLGDRTRMPELARRTFVRPSPARGHLGGVAAHTHAAVALCEAAGYDVVLVESVGVGQSELAIDDVVDAVLLLLPPAGGDDLQGVKAGIMEIADVVAVTKDDGSTKKAAAAALGDVKRALRSGSEFRRKYGDRWRPKATKCTIFDAATVAAVWERCRAFRAALGEAGAAAGDGAPPRLPPLAGALLSRRRRQRVSSTWDLARRDVLAAFATHPAVTDLFRSTVRGDLDAAAATPRESARHLVDAFLEAPRRPGQP